MLNRQMWKEILLYVWIINHLNPWNTTYWALLYQELYVREHNDHSSAMVCYYFSYFIDQETKEIVK